jgi:predicted glycosyltransferase
LLQLPSLLRTKRKEHRWLQQLLEKESFDLIISDNRPGLWTTQTTCVYITHQLMIHSGKGQWFNRLLQKVHTRMMKKFHQVWVPDLEGTSNLAGHLSHPEKPLLQPNYIGFLSRLSMDQGVSVENDLLILISGPEPQRSLFEQQLVAGLKNYKGKVVLVRGLPKGADVDVDVNSNVTVFPHLTANKLQEVMASSRLIICRSGYTSLMDLVKLRKQALLVPTPGQPEQEYLAQYMQEQGFFPFLAQRDLSIEKALAKAATFRFKNPFEETDFEQYQLALDDLLLNEMTT